MSIAISYQALPEQSRILEEFRSTGRFGHLLRAISIALTRQTFSRPLDAEDEAFLQQVEELRISHPGIEIRNYRIGWQWHSLAYLISGNHRKDNAEPDPGGDVGSRAVFGAEELLGSRGKQLRWSSAAQVREIASYLANIDGTQLAQHYNPHKMEDFGVYRFSADEAETEWHDIAASFDGLRAFHLEAAKHGEASLIVVD